MPEHLEPDFALYIDVSPERVLERLQRKKSVMETLETQKKVREIYLKYVEKGELIRIDGDKNKDAVAQEVYFKVMSLLKKANFNLKKKNKIGLGESLVFSPLEQLNC